MKLLIDNALSPRLIDELRSRGVEAVHVRAIGLGDATDSEILERAMLDGSILVSRDVDFAGLLVHANKAWPSFVHLRSRGLTRPADQAEAICQTLISAARDLERGAIVVVRNDRIRVRSLPVSGSE